VSSPPTFMTRRCRKGRNRHGCCKHRHSRVGGDDTNQLQQRMVALAWTMPLMFQLVCLGACAGATAKVTASVACHHCSTAHQPGRNCPAWHPPHSCFSWSVCMDVQEQQLRSQALQPFIVAPPSRGIVGTSRFAQRMKAQVMQAAKDPTR